MPADGRWDLTRCLNETKFKIFHCYCFVLSSLEGGPSSIPKFCFIYHSTQCYYYYVQTL